MPIFLHNVSTSNKHKFWHWMSPSSLHLNEQIRHFNSHYFHRGLAALGKKLKS